MVKQFTILFKIKSILDLENENSLVQSMIEEDKNINKKRLDSTTAAQIKLLKK